MKKFILGVIIGMLFSCMFVAAFSMNLTSDNKIESCKAEIRINHRLTTLGENSLTINDKTYVPLRALCDEANLQIIWKEETNYQQYYSPESISLNLPYINETDVIISDKQIHLVEDNVKKKIKIAKETIVKPNITAVEAVKIATMNIPEYSFLSLFEVCYDEELKVWSVMPTPWTNYVGNDNMPLFRNLGIAIVDINGVFLGAI